MNAWTRVLCAILTIMITPAFALEAIYLDAVPVTNPGEYLAPPNLYMQVPPPAVSFQASGNLAPATVYDSHLVNAYNAARPSGNSAAYAAYAPPAKPERETSGEKLRLLLQSGLDHATDVPLAVLREHLAESENVELVGEGDDFDVKVEVETMKLAATATVFLVINAYKEVDGESLIFYNNFGYLGELKLLSGSTSYATNLEAALQVEAERQQE